MKHVGSTPRITRVGILSLIPTGSEHSTSLSLGFLLCYMGLIVSSLMRRLLKILKELIYIKYLANSLYSKDTVVITKTLFYAFDHFSKLLNLCYIWFAHL